MNDYCFICGQPGYSYSVDFDEDGNAIETWFCEYHWTVKVKDLLKMFSLTVLLVDKDILPDE